MSKSVIQLAYGFVNGALFEEEFSKASFESIFFDVFAYCTLILEQIFDQHKKEIDTAIYEQKSGTPRWYRNMVLNFQYGFNLLPDSDKFDNTGYTVDQIEASKIVKYCSVRESLESNQLTIKVAGEDSNALIQLTDLQKIACLEFTEEVKYAGVKINLVNNPADKLELVMAVYRNVLVIDNLGNSILNGGKPVEEAISNYMKNLPFDGELVLNDLIETLRAVEGVDNVNIVNAQSKYWDVVTSSYTNLVPINVKTIPVSGYFVVENFNTVTYVV